MLPASYNLKNPSMYSNQFNQVSDSFSNPLYFPNPNITANRFNTSDTNDCMFDDLLRLNNVHTDGSEFVNTNMLCGRSSLSGPNFSNVNRDSGSNFRVADAPSTLHKHFDNERHFVQNNIRPRVSGFTGSRVLSNLQENRTHPFVTNMNADTFVPSRLGLPMRDNRTNAVCTSNSVCNSNSNAILGLENILENSQNFGMFFNHPLRSQSTDEHGYTINASLPQPSCHSEMNHNRSEHNNNNYTYLDDTSSGYYTNDQFENTKKLQASGRLKEASWILVPPFPECSGAHLRTGRVHEFKSTMNDNSLCTFLMDEDLRQILRNKIQACLFTGGECADEKLPRNLGAYTEIIPLEVAKQPRPSVTYSLPGVCFKAWSSKFNRPFCLRRVILPSDYQASLSSEAYAFAKQLSKLDNSAIVGFRDVFFTNAFGDNSVIFVYEYIPCALTLQQVHMSDPMKLTSFSSPFNTNRTERPHSAMKNAPNDLGMPHESLLWSYLIQLTQGLRFIHQQLCRSCGILDPTKVLVQEGSRIRINSLGLRDILFNSAQNAGASENYTEDFVQLGKLIIGVACGTAAALQTSQRASSLNLLQRAYQPDMVALMRNLISGKITDINQLVQSTASFAYDHMIRMYDYSDHLERQLLFEMECDRLFRMICKLQSIVERNDHQGGVSHEWSETGDRYMLKLFRDFVFYQTDQLGAPYLDLAHIISVLNKVEAASTESLCLVSRDSQNVIIVTYADVKQWLDTSFTYLVDKHRQSRCEIQISNQREMRKHQQQIAAEAITQSMTSKQLDSISTNTELLSLKD